jgi:hypothetical protein
VQAFLSLNVDEIIIVDNQSWLLVHVYVMHAWKKNVVEGGNVDNLITMIAQSVM